MQGRTFGLVTIVRLYTLAVSCIIVILQTSSNIVQFKISFRFVNGKSPCRLKCV